MRKYYDEAAEKVIMAYMDGKISMSDNDFYSWGVDSDHRWGKNPIPEAALELFEPFDAASAEQDG